MSTTTDGEDDGMFQRALRRMFGKSYRTTLPGLLSVGCGLAVAADQFISNHALHVIAQICVAAGITGAGVIGIGAKASNVTGAGRRAITVPGKMP